jgi:hypothetical protein
MSMTAHSDIGSTYDGAAHVKNETPNPKMKRPSRNCGTPAEAEIMAVPRQIMKPASIQCSEEGGRDRLNAYLPKTCHYDGHTGH